MNEGAPPSDSATLMQQVLGTAATAPHQIPPEFLAYLVDYLQVTPLALTYSQIVGGGPLPSVIGSIPATGTTATAGVGFTYTHTDTSGVYVFTFTGTPFAAAPSVIVTTKLANTAATVTAVSSTGFTVTVRACTTNAAIDAAFNFRADAIPV